MLDEIEKAPSAKGAFSEMSSAGRLDYSENSPPRQNAQIKFLHPHQAEAEFDAEIALELASSHWRTAALLLNLTAKYAEAGDYLNLDLNRRRAREQFIEANDVFRRFQEARAAAADGIAAEAFR